MLKRAAIWLLAVALGVLFLLIGFSKLTCASGMNWAARLSHWGYPPAARFVIGGIEILAGLGLLVPRLRRAAATALMVVMTGAFLTHLAYREWVHLLPPFILGALTYALYRWQIPARE